MILNDTKWHYMILNDTENVTIPNDAEWYQGLMILSGI